VYITAGISAAVDSSQEFSASELQSAQRIARTIVAERVRSVVARNRTRRRRLLSSSSDVREDNFNYVTSYDGGLVLWLSAVSYVTSL